MDYITIRSYSEAIKQSQLFLELALAKVEKIEDERQAMRQKVSDFELRMDNLLLKIKAEYTRSNM